MGEITHKHVFIDEALGLLPGYSTEENGGNFYAAHYNYTGENVLVSTVPIRQSSKHLSIEELFAGKREELSNELIDKLLIASDTSENPSRPFRWYKYAAFDCADTNNEEDIDRVRQTAMCFKTN